MLVAIAVLLVFGVFQELVSGITMSTHKWGPRTVHSMTDEPFRYWASVVLHSVAALVFAALSVAAFWLAGFEAEVKTAPKKPKVR